MLPELETLSQSIERRKADMLACLDALSDADRRRATTPADWSPLQVLEHIVMVEEWMAGPDAPTPPADAKVQLKGHLFITFGGGVMRSALRIPTLPQAVPTGSDDFATLRARWEQSRADLASRLSRVTPATRPRPISLHPVAGPLNALQVLNLLDTHLTYHLRHFPRLP